MSSRRASQNSSDDDDIIAAARVGFLDEAGEMLPTERVLAEMSALGLRGTELGAPGFLPSTADEIRALLDRYGMSLLGAFTPVVPHDAAQVEASLIPNTFAMRWRR